MKTPYVAVADSRDVPSRIRAVGARTVIFDIEPLVAHWDSSQAALDHGIADVVSEMAAIDGVQVVCFATNSARFPSARPAAPPGLQVRYLTSARKPLRTAPYAELPRPGVVVGDQIATDGLLAHRIGFTFLHFQPRPGSVPAGPRALMRCGDVLRPLIFARAGGA